jgi:serine phosphatase RsbU (regulator of sigma subunit)
MSIDTHGDLMVKGRMLAATVRSMSSLGSLGVQALAELGIHDIDIDQWYPAEARRAMHRIALARYGPEALYSFGFTTSDLQYSMIPQMQAEHRDYLNATRASAGDLVAESRALESIIHKICEAYTVNFAYMVDRYQHLFGARCTALGDNQFEIVASTFAEPDHHEFTRGIFASFLIRCTADDWDMAIRYLPEKTDHGPNWAAFHYHVRFERRASAAPSAEVILVERRLEAREALLTNVVEQSNRSLSVIMESIQYARLLQQGQMPDIAKLSGPFRSIDIAWQPRDLIGGDIWWTFQGADGSFTLVLVDCTGHGVPGAMLSVLVISTLTRVFAQAPSIRPAEALKALDAGMRESLHKDGEDKVSDDGCDAAIIRISPDGSELIYSGAKIDLFHRHGDEITQLRATRISLGYLKPPTQAPEEHCIAMARGDLLVMLTDGVTDQIGSGPERRKSFGNRRIQRVLADSSIQTASDAGRTLLAALADWQGKDRRRDDVSIVAIVC